MRLPLIFFVVLFALAGPAHSARLESLRLPNGWTGSAYSNKSGRFSSCAASASYRSGDNLHVSIDRKYKWSIAIGIGSGGVRNGITNVNIRFDGGRWLPLKGVVSKNNLLIIPMPSNSNLMRRFRKGLTMHVRYAGRKAGFRLTGTSKMFVVLAACVVRHNAKGNSVAGLPAPTNKTVAKLKNQQPARPKSKGSSGTGIAISSAGHILTNHHVVKGCTTIRATTHGGIATKARLLKTDRRNDLAVIKIDAQLPADAIALFSSERSVKLGETIAVYGFPFAGALSSSGNVVSGNVTSLAGLRDDARYLQISAPVQPGNSGGPLVDQTGKIVGVVTARMNDLATVEATGALPQNVNFALKANIALNFLDAHSIPYGLAEAAEPLPLTELAAKSQRFTAFIQCK